MLIQKYQNAKASSKNLNDLHKILLLHVIPQTQMYINKIYGFNIEKKAPLNELLTLFTDFLEGKSEFKSLPTSVEGGKQHIQTQTKEEVMSDILSQQDPSEFLSRFQFEYRVPEEYKLTANSSYEDFVKYREALNNIEDFKILSGFGSNEVKVNKFMEKIRSRQYNTQRGLPIYIPRSHLGRPATKRAYETIDQELSKMQQLMTNKNSKNRQAIEESVEKINKAGMLIENESLDYLKTNTTVGSAVSEYLEKQEREEETKSTAAFTGDG